MMYFSLPSGAVLSIIAETVRNAAAQNARATAMLFIVVFIFPFPFRRLTFSAFVVIFAPFGRFYTLFYTLLLF
jgi:hypothetical protein